jgi:hypothetical protein
MKFAIIFMFSSFVSLSSFAATYECNISDYGKSSMGEVLISDSTPIKAIEYEFDSSDTELLKKRFDFSLDGEDLKIFVRFQVTNKNKNSEEEIVNESFILKSTVELSLVIFKGSAIVGCSRTK